ncbi:DUF4352 domain-containing protein [Actinoplanes sp. KI2]|uniref:DUF4352 domain-containing protein n=1 Tax=Actinoplanes sp. KI2 TaxID=2983315 RepID=UPI0021D56ED0|nr:DUF4352 domain-containing protein [Actinoplanes sp. KI2]MCU7727587.1 DUF4352 domain-containing protein [Actinoplanes sp. KI2]
MSNDHNRRHPSAHRPHYETGRPHPEAGTHYEGGRPHSEAGPHYEGSGPHAQHGQPGGRAYPPAGRPAMQAGQPAMPGADYRAGSDGRAGHSAPSSSAQSGGPRPGGPQSGGPQSGGPQSGGPQSGGPQSGGPQSGGPQSGGPQPGGPQPGGPQSGGPQSGGPQSAPRKRTRWLLVFGGLFVVMILGLAGLLAYALGWPGPVMKALGIDQNTGKAAGGRMNQPIADGTFEFTVTAARCGVHQVGEGNAGQPAQGQFCLVDVTVKNVGGTPVIFDDVSQTAYDGTGNQYSADASADVIANKDRPAFLQAIDPGATVQGRLAFDISTREKLTAIVLHESIFSDGVRIPLVS